MPMKPKAGGTVYSTPAVHAGQTLFVPAESSMQRADTPEQPTQEDEAKARKRARALASSKRSKAWRLANPAYHKEYYATDEAKSRRKQREQRHWQMFNQHWQLFKQLPRPPLLPKPSVVLGRATTWTWRVAGRYMYRKKHMGASEFYRSLSAQNRIAMQKLHVSITPELLRRYTHLTKKEASIRLSLSTQAMAIICRSHGVMNQEWEKERRRYMKPKAPYRGDALAHTYRQSHTIYLPCVALGSCADRH